MNFFAPQQTAHKLLDLSVHLRELGHLHCVVNQPLNCSINGEEANQKVCLGGWVCVCVKSGWGKVWVWYIHVHICVHLTWSYNYVAMHNVYWASPSSLMRQRWCWPNGCGRWMSWGTSTTGCYSSVYQRCYFCIICCRRKSQMWRPLCMVSASFVAMTRLPGRMHE